MFHGSVFHMFCIIQHLASFFITNDTWVFPAGWSYTDLSNLILHSRCPHQIHFQSFTLNCSFQAIRFSCRPAIVSAIKTTSSAYNVSFIMPSFISLVPASITLANSSGDKADPWCTPTSTWNSLDKCVPTFTFVFAPSHGHITAMTNASGIPFFLIAHSKTFLGTQSNTFSRSTKHMYSLFCFLIYLPKNQNASIVHFTGKKPICKSTIATTFLNLNCIF